MTSGERFTLGLVACTQATVFIRGSTADSAFEIVLTLLSWATLAIMGFVLMVAGGTKQNPPR